MAHSFDSIRLVAQQGLWSESADAVAGDTWAGSSISGIPPYLGYQGNGRTERGRSLTPWDRVDDVLRRVLRRPHSGQARYVFGGESAADAGAKRYPYLGPWVDGATIVNRGPDTALILEWERGSDSWRETYLNAGDSMTVDLGDETVTVGTAGASAAWDNVLIESNDDDGRFEVDVTGVAPQCLPVSSSTPSNRYEGLRLTPLDGAVLVELDGPFDDYEVRIAGQEWQHVTGRSHRFEDLDNGCAYLVEARIRSQVWKGRTVRSGPISSAEAMPAPAHRRRRERRSRASG